MEKEPDEKLGELLALTNDVKIREKLKEIRFITRRMTYSEKSVVLFNRNLIKNTRRKRLNEVATLDFWEPEVDAKFDELFFLIDIQSSHEKDEVIAKITEYLSHSDAEFDKTYRDFTLDYIIIGFIILAYIVGTLIYILHL
jgi:hypothetical protein